MHNFGWDMHLHNTAACSPTSNTIAYSYAALGANPINSITPCIWQYLSSFGPLTFWDTVYIVNRTSYCSYCADMIIADEHLYGRVPVIWSSSCSECMPCSECTAMCFFLLVLPFNSVAIPSTEHQRHQRLHQLSLTWSVTSIWLLLFILCIIIKVTSCIPQADNSHGQEGIW